VSGQVRLGLVVPGYVRLRLVVLVCDNKILTRNYIAE
jgi:hypothetical protein